MSKRREIKGRLATLSEINGIMKTMKNLALLEIRKLETFLVTQRRVVTSIEAAAQDCLYFYPPIQAYPPSLRQLLVMVGSERGFCGDYNESLITFLNDQELPGDTLLVAVGRKLETRLYEDPRIAAFIEGPGVAEEVQIALQRLIHVLNELQQSASPEIGRIGVLYYDDKSERIRLRQLLPLSLSELPETKLTYSHPPLLNLEPIPFLSQLTDQYLYVLLHEVFYSSLMMENHKRLTHMDHAIHHLEKEVARLRLTANRLRQEEIIDEIEIIMLSAEVLSDND